jgi:hypothetical protein
MIQIFPDAKFLVLERNPFSSLRSIRSFRSETDQVICKMAALLNDVEVEL